MSRETDFDDFIAYYNDDIVIYTDRDGEEHYQARCSKCDNWYDINSELTYTRINGFKVGDPSNQITVEYPYSVSVFMSKCECGYIRLHDSKTLEEMTEFKASDATETCKYRDAYDSYVCLKYKILDAEMIAKYILGFCYELLLDAMRYFDFVAEMIKRNEIMDVCLIGVIICDIIDRCEYTEEDLDDWYRDGMRNFSPKELADWNSMASSII